MRFRSPHLVSKGTVIRIAGGLLGEIDPAKEDCLLCVTSTALEPGKAGYEIYAEFEGADLNFLQAVRRWLSERVTEKKAA